MTRRKTPTVELNLAAVKLGSAGGKRRAENRGWEKIKETDRKKFARAAAITRWAKAKAEQKAASPKKQRQARSSAT